MLAAFGLASTGYVLHAPHAQALPSQRVPALQMAALKITGAGEILTPALRKHTEDKISIPLDKFASVLNDAKDAELHMKVENRGSHDEKHVGKAAHIAELTAHLKGKQRTVTVHSESEDMYATIDELESLLARKLRKAKERWADTQKERNASSKDQMATAGLDESEEDTPTALSSSKKGKGAKAAAAPEPAAPAGFSWGDTY